MILERHLCKHLEKTIDFIMASLNLPESEVLSNRDNLESRLLENLSFMTGKSVTRFSASRMLKSLMQIIEYNKNEKKPFLVRENDNLPFVNYDLPLEDDFPLLDEYRNGFRESRGTLRNLYKTESLRGITLVRHATAFLYYLSFYLPHSNDGSIDPYLFESFFHNRIDKFTSFEQCQTAASETKEFSRIINLSEFGETFRYGLKSRHHGPEVLSRGAFLDSRSTDEESIEYNKAHWHRSRFFWISFSYFQLQSVKLKFDKSYEACGDEKLSALISALTNIPTNQDANKIDESLYIKVPANELGYSFESSLDLFKKKPVTIYLIVSAINLGIPMDILKILKSYDKEFLVEFKETVDSSGIDMTNLTTDQLSWINSWMGDDSEWEDTGGK